MPNDLDRLLWLMAGRLGQSDLPICQLVAAELDRSVGQPHAKAAPQSSIIPLKFDDINPPCGQAHMDLYQAILQTAPIYQALPGTTKFQTPCQPYGGMRNHRTGWPD